MKNKSLVGLANGDNPIKMCHEKTNFFLHHSVWVASILIKLAPWYDQFGGPGILDPFKPRNYINWCVWFFILLEQIQR